MISPNTMGITFNSPLMSKEQLTLARLVERMGFELSLDENGNLVADRPAVIDRRLFMGFVAQGGEDPRYGGRSFEIFCLASKGQAYGTDPFYEKFPGRVITGGSRHSSMFIVRETILLAAEWCEDNTQRRNFTTRLASAWHAAYVNSELLSGVHEGTEF